MPNIIEEIAKKSCDLIDGNEGRIVVNKAGALSCWKARAHFQVEGDPEDVAGRAGRYYIYLRQRTKPSPCGTGI